MTAIYNILNGTLLIIMGILWAVGIYLRSKGFLHIMQLEGYKNKNYSDWLKTNSSKAFNLKIILLGIIAFASVMLLLLSKSIYVGIAISLVWTTVFMLLSVEFKKKSFKKELVFTPRAKRLLVSNFLVIGIISILFAIIPSESLIKFIAGSSILYIFIPGTMMIGNIIVTPIEKSVNRYYYNKAYEKIRTFEDLRIVGITGSYGKTSTKFVTAKILEEKYNVLKTPDSYNTPMGVSKIINNTLTDEYEAFVVEMGARNIGDIKEMAKLAGPQIGIITSIGPTHLETFKNIENIMKTKYELIEELPADGVAIFNYDNQHVKKLADKTFKEKILYGMDNTEELDLFAIDIKVSETGSTFLLKDKEGNSILCKSQLLGKHNISNLLAGAAVGKAMGLSLEQIASGIGKVEPVPHRLQLMNPGTGVIVIDDSFNSNPVSSKAALEVIAQFKEGRKVIVTPGMVELGDQEEEANRQFGRYIAEVCDYVILVGKNRTKPIYEGIIEKGFDESKIFVVSSLDEATNVIQKTVRAKDIVLFENDLPDTYNE